MQNTQYLTIFYVFFWLVRIRGCVRRGRQPLLCGPDWFFNVHVRPGFYEGAGKKLLHGYWMRMLIPFAFDVPIATAIFLSGRLQLLIWLILGLCALIHINHCVSVDLAERQARVFGLPENQQPTSSIALSLTPRRLRDYSNGKVEWGLALASVLALVLLLRYYFAAPEHHDVRVVFGVPAALLYLQVGFLFAKRVVVAWRTSIPQTQVAEHVEAKEETRKHYLRMCDWSRASAVAGMLFWPVKLSMTPASFARVGSIWFAVWMGIGVALTIWVEIKRKHLANLAVRARPVTLPDLLGQPDGARWPLCYQPATPMLMLKGGRGYSLNLANSLAQLGAFYLAGWLALVAVLRVGH